jgi:hypothetical protein
MCIAQPAAMSGIDSREDGIMRWLLVVSLIGLMLAIAGLPRPEMPPLIVIFAMLFGMSAGILGTR